MRRHGHFEETHGSIRYIPFLGPKSARQDWPCVGNDVDYAIGRSLRYVALFRGRGFVMLCECLRTI